MKALTEKKKKKKLNIQVNRLALRQSDETKSRIKIQMKTLQGKVEEISPGIIYSFSLSIESVLGTLCSCFQKATNISKHLYFFLCPFSTMDTFILLRIYLFVV